MSVRELRLVDAAVICLLVNVVVRMPRSESAPPQAPTATAALASVETPSTPVGSEPGGATSVLPSIGFGHADVCRWAAPAMPTPASYAESLAREARAYEASPKYQHKIDEM